MTKQIPEEEQPIHDENHIIAERRAKLTQLRQKQAVAFPNSFRRSALAADLQHNYANCDRPELESLAVDVAVAGRIMAKRIMGKASFIQIKDGSGLFQLYVQQETFGEAFYDDEFKHWDIGDIVGAKGRIFRTGKGELSLKATSIELLCKSLRPLPEKFHGLSDQEIKYRQRYVDLIMSDESRHLFRTRSRIIAQIRDFMAQRDYLEVETPMMHSIPGGASARPFVTYHNALDMDLYLRIAPELYLKRLVVGGFERVFEINRNFRNEGLSTRHNPEFTMIELYQAYADYTDMMELTESMLRELAEKVYGSTLIHYQGKTFDFGKPFKKIGLADSISHYYPEISRESLATIEGARQAAVKLNVPIKAHYRLGRIHVEIFEQCVEHLLQDPTFITAYPTEVSPLARCHDTNPEVTDRFEFFIGGREIANGFSELNDPEDQAARFRRQVEEKEAGDLEAMHYDADYITALEYGLPPTAGEGIGIDRLVMLFTDAPSIRDVLLFPQMRHQ
ncbi:MAG: lysine--tRNA ligase [Gammaproteobacteria bacterium]|nr:lysine--tRNA ligase [Gammaproteobacteria bacterium]